MVHVSLRVLIDYDLIEGISHLLEVFYFLVCQVRQLVLFQNFLI